MTAETTGSVNDRIERIEAQLTEIEKYVETHKAGDIVGWFRNTSPVVAWIGGILGLLLTFQTLRNSLFAKPEIEIYPGPLLGLVWFPE